MNESRAERRRALVLGKVRLRSLPPQFWLWTMALLAGFGVVYWKITQGQLENAKTAVMAKQRAVSKTLGPKIIPFRDRVEGAAQELAKNPWSGDVVAAEADLTKITTSPGVYLRLRLENARSPKTIRRAALASLHDGFTSCFFVREKAQDPTQGPKCISASDCAPGLLCNEWDVCAPPAEPYNLRLAYRSLRVLSTEWTDELHEATTDLAVVGYGRDLEKVTRHDVPIAVDLLTRAKYLTIVLDEDPPAGLPAEKPDAGDETPEERVQRTAHHARVGIWDLKTGAPLARIRAEAAGQFVAMGRSVVRDAQNLAAQQRQANSCALALGVKQRLDRPTTAQVPPPASP